jgi:hypothetical protein
MLAMTSEVPAGLTDPDARVGGYYELSIWLGDRDDARLQTAVEALARAAGVTGPWRKQPDGYVPASWTDVAAEAGGGGAGRGGTARRPNVDLRRGGDPE